MKTVRCAIYTRKSSEEGLEQAFNSLDAQREACAAYILSQASEGWAALPDIYDDGGLSGGSLERPALQRLLAEVAAGRIDIIVVYKVDRLTRSLLDFSKLVEAFDKAGTSFVSVTQSFNTTTSMGRLTLNMLLSFAQFEREVTAERIRDKIAASKAKGMWMGGTPPLGYRPNGRTLTIVPEHAEIVRSIFGLYLSLGSVRLVAERLAKDSVVAPVRETRSGRPIGGKPFSRGQLYFMLRSPIYVGDIPHRDVSYPGLHEAIIDRATWDQVQTRLRDQRQGERRGPRGSSCSLLTGKVVDGDDHSLIASHACKGATRYRYYVSRPERPGAALRVPALELEAAIARCVAEALDDPMTLCARAGLTITPASLPGLAERAAALGAKLRRRDRAAARSLIEQVRILEQGLEIDCAAAALAAALGLKVDDEGPPTVRLRSAAQLRRSGAVMRLIQPDGHGVTQAPSPSLNGLLVKSRRWWSLLKAGDIDVTTLAKREGVTRSYLTRVVRLTFLAPDVVDAILGGTIKAGVDSEMLTLPGAIPARWREQIERFLPGIAQ